MSDTTNDRVLNILREAAVDAYDTREPVELRFCECRHEDGTHYGVDGQLHCSELGCGCQRFTYHHSEWRKV